MKRLGLFLLSVISLSAQVARFPGSVVTDQQLGVMGNSVLGTLNTSIIISDTSILLTNGTCSSNGILTACNLAFVPYMFITVQNEIMQVCSITTQTLTTTLNLGIVGSACPSLSGRGLDGSQRVAHTISNITTIKVYNNLVAWNNNAKNKEIEAIEANATKYQFAAGINGAVCDATITDDTAALNALILVVYNAGGGVIYVKGSCFISGLVVIPNNGNATQPTQPFIRITGDGGAGINFLTALGTAPSKLNLTNNASIAKIDTRGAGILEIDHILLGDSSTDCAAFIQTTNTIVNIHDMTFSGTGRCNDAVIFGGTTTTISNGSNAAFQGYGSRMHNVFFNKIQRGFYIRCFGNSIFLNQLSWDTTTGSTGTVGGGTVDGSCLPGQSGVGIVMSNFLEELTGYTYGLDFVDAQNVQMFGISQWDKPINGLHITGAAGGTTISCAGCTLASASGGTIMKDDATGTILAQYNPSGISFGDLDTNSCRILQNSSQINLKLGNNSTFCPLFTAAITSSTLAATSGFSSIATDGNGKIAIPGLGSPTQFLGGINTMSINYATDSGANNALVASIPQLTSLRDGLMVILKLQHSLRVGANTFNLNALGVVPIKSAQNYLNDIGSVFGANSMIQLVYHSGAGIWELLGQ